MPSLTGAFAKIRRVGTKGKHDALSQNSLATKSSEPKTLDSSSTSASELNVDGYPLSKKQTHKKTKRGENRERNAVAAQQKADAIRHREEADRLAEQEEPHEIRQRYGDLPLVQSTERTFEPRWQLKDISAIHVGKQIQFRARVHVTRNLSAKLAFFVFRQQLSTFQGVLQQTDGVITTHMVQWAERIPAGSILLVKGTLQHPARHDTIKGCTVHDAELMISDLHVIARRPEAVPFTVYEDEVSKDHEHDNEGHTAHITDRVRLHHRLLDLRTTTSKAIFRIQSGICNLFRSYLDSQGFIEIHTPKLQGGATESGASVFQLDYFGRPAFLAQSPQLAKQMCIAADFERVYEIGPVFRAENSNTHRHLTEYTGLDIEMSIEEHYHEALELIDHTLKHIFQGLYERFALELKTVKHHFPHEDLVWLKETPIIPFRQGVQMLIDSGWRDEDGNPPSPDEDLGTRDEIRLGQLVKEQYHTDYYVLDKFPASARPFYTMPDSKDKKFTNSFDIFVRGQEIISGGQRIHDAKMLEDQMDKMGVDPSSMQEYMDGFRYAAPPHAGAGVGLERILMLILNLGNIRLGSLFPRDPKSLSAQPAPPELRHLHDSTSPPPWGDDQPPDEANMQPLENLIANYGDSTNTSWTDDRYQIWRHPQNGAAISYVPTNGFAILPGDPLCEIHQYTNVAATFLKWLKKETRLKPIWVLVGHDMEETLGNKFGWKTLTCVAEERIDATKPGAEKDHGVARKVRHAENEGVKIKDIDEGRPVPDEIKQQCDVRIKEWLANRQGKQIHLSEITPWRDESHRRYFYAQDRDGRICAMVVLAQLAPRHGYQVKYSLDFAGAPSGTIEHITLHAIKAAKQSGTQILTFGSAATSELHAVHHLTGARVRMLQHTYESLAKQFKLTNKSEFRQKLGGEEDAVYVCYPPHGLGVKGSKAIVHFFESDH